MFQRFLKYVLQSVLGMVGVAVYIFTDTFFISKYAGADGLAILNIILPIYGVIEGIGNMIAVGCATRYGIAKAAGEKSDHFFMQAIFWNLIISFPIVLAGIFIPGKIVALLGADAHLAVLGTGYLKTIFIGSPLLMINFSLQSFARNDGAPGYAMAAAIGSTSFNIVFDYIFLFMTPLGLTGAALATALSPLMSILATAFHYLGKNNQVGFSVTMPSFKVLFTTCQLGVSAFVGEMASAVITVIFNMLLLKLVGNVAVAAYGVTANLSLIAMAFFNGAAQGAQPLMSEAYGKGDTRQQHQVLKYTIGSALVLATLVISVAWIFTEPLIAIFNSANNQELAYYACDGLRYYFTGFAVAGINIVIISYNSAVAKPIPAFIGSMLRGFLCIGASAICLSSIFGINGVWFSFLCSEIITCIIILPLSKKNNKNFK